MSWVRDKQVISRLLIVKLVLALGLFTLYPLEADGKRIRVRGYYRKDGTYVRSHYRTVPDGNPYNNYSYPGNYNPNTDKITTGDPLKYLDRYYNRRTYSSSSSSSADFNKWLRDLKTKYQTNDSVKVRGYYRKDGTNDILENDGYFTVGSTRDEVIAVQGTPDSFSKHRFAYGFSDVYFSNERVTSWKNSYLNPLKAKLVPAKYTSNRGYFTVGSTRDKVIAVQGTPDSFSKHRFAYGFSDVYFSNERVTSWKNSYLNPLKVR